MVGRPIAVLDSLRFGPIVGAAGRPNSNSRSLTPIREERGWVRDDSATGAAVRMQPYARVASDEGVDSETTARNGQILDGVIRGIGFYGNCFGVPTVGGEVHIRAVLFE